jgi:CRP-like cAMP-binding protein
VSKDKAGDARRSPNSRLSLFRKHPAFSDLEPKAFDQLCRYAKHTSVKRGTTIFSKGDPGNSLFAIMSGTVKISLSSSEGRNAILNLIGPGELVGEVAVLGGKGRTADATASTDCEILVIDRRDFLPFVQSQPVLAMKFIELLCNRLRHTSEQVEQLILLNLPGRLASALLGLTEKRRPDLDSRTAAVTQMELSEMVGMTRESINKQLRAWAACGWVQLKRGGIVVVDANSLRQLIEARSGSDE